MKSNKNHTSIALWSWWAQNSSLVSKVATKALLYALWCGRFVAFSTVCKEKKAQKYESAVWRHFVGQFVHLSSWLMRAKCSAQCYISASMNNTSNVGHDGNPGAFNGMGMSGHNSAAAACALTCYIEHKFCCYRWKHSRIMSGCSVSLFLFMLWTAPFSDKTFIS